MNTIARQIGDLHLARENDSARRDFAKVVRAIALGRDQHGGALDAARLGRDGDRVVEALKAKAAVDPLSIGSVGGVLSPFELLANAFLNSLALVGCFDAMLGSMMRLPLRSRIVAVTSTLTGASLLSESDVKRAGSLQLSASDLTISKVAAFLAISEEVLRGGGDGGLTFLERELRQAVALATDTAFLALITTGATSIPSSGTSANAMRLDLRALLQTINLGSASRLFLIMNADAAAAWASVGDASGGPCFPDATWNGGSVAGIPIVPTDGALANQIILADASGIAANTEGLRIDSTEVASLNMDSAPDSPPIASTAYVNLWQQDMLAVKVERFFGAKVARPNSVALISNANYTGNSP
jgi:Phage capsid family